MSLQVVFRLLQARYRPNMGSQFVRQKEGSIVEKAHVQLTIRIMTIQLSLFKNKVPRRSAKKCSGNGSVLGNSYNIGPC